MSAFDYEDYKAYVRAQAGGKGQRRGIKLALARALRCQPTYISQVLNGAAHLSLEQAETLAGFFEQTDEEKQFFLLMVLRDRAGTSSLRAYFQKQLDAVQAQRLLVTQRLGKHEHLSEEQKSRYYSSWLYAAVHIALTIPSLRTPEALSGYFRISRKKISEVLAFLEQAGLARRAGEAYEVGARIVRLGNDSHQIIKHHSHWRNQAIEALEREEITDLHYSGVVSLSRMDALRIKDLLLEQLRGHLKTIRDSSPEEELYCYLVDFFSLKR